MNTDRHDDAGMDRLLRAALEPATPEGGPLCPDADTVAAYADGGLGARERTELEPHLSSCARCQAVLAMMAREGGNQPTGPRKVPVWRDWLSVRRLRWLVPAAGAVVAIAVYVSVGSDPSTTTDLTVVPGPSALTNAPFTMAERAEPAPVPALQPPLPAESTFEQGRASASPARPEPTISQAERVVVGRPPAGFIPASPAPVGLAVSATPVARPSAAAPAVSEAETLERTRAAGAVARDTAAPAPAPKGFPAANVVTVAEARAVPVQGRRAREAAPERGKRVRLYSPNVGSGFTVPTQWPFSGLVVRARVSAVGRARLAPAEQPPGRTGPAPGLVPMAPIEFEIVEVFKRGDGIRPDPNITVWLRGGEVEDAATIHRVDEGDGVQTHEGDEFVLFLEHRDNDPDSRAFEPFGFADGLYRLVGDRVVIGLNRTPDPLLTRSTLLARLRQLAGTATR